MTKTNVFKKTKVQFEADAIIGKLVTLPRKQRSAVFTEILQTSWIWLRQRAEPRRG